MKHLLRLFIVTLLGLAAHLGASAQQLRVLKATTPGSNDAGYRFLLDLKAGIESRAPGRLRVDVYGNSGLGSIPNTVDGLVMGTIEVINTAVGFYVGIDPRFSVFDAAGEFENIEHALRTMDDPVFKERLKFLGRDRGIEPLMFYSAGQLHLIARSPVTSLADLKGSLVRVPGGPLHVEPMRQLGMNPITMSIGDALPALMNRTVDAVVATESVLIHSQYYDVAKHATALPGSYLICAVLVNRSMLKALGPELEAIVREEAAKAASLVPARNIEESTRVLNLWAEKGGKFYVLNPADRQRYATETRAVAARLAAASPAWRETYEAMQAAAKRQRR